MSKILAIANAKGGVGKTTTAVSLAAALTERKRQVLTVDLDPQASLTLSLGLFPDRLKQTIRDALDEHAVPVASILISTQENFDLVPANRSLDRAAQALEKGRVRIGAVRAALEPLIDRYDYILLDCPASAGILTGAALAAADQVIIPVTTDYLTLESVKWFLSIVKNIQEKVNPNLQIGGIFYTMYDPRTQHAREVMEAVQALCDSGIPLFATTVRDCVQFKEASRAGQSIIRHSPRSPGARAYRALAKEIEEGVQESQENELNRVLTRGQELLARKDLQGAFAAFCRATDLNPKLPSAWVGRAESSARWDDAVRAYVRAIGVEPENQQIRGGLEARLKDKMMHATRSDIPDMVTLAHYLEEVGEVSHAGDLFRCVTGLDDAHEQAWIGRARTTPNSKDALSCLQRCLEINPNSEAAQKALKAVEERLRTDAMHAFKAAVALEKRAKRDEAHNLFTQAVELDPTNDGAWVGRARTGRDLHAGLSYVKQALKINPRNSEARELYRLLWEPEEGPETGLPILEPHLAKEKPSLSEEKAPSLAANQREEPVPVWVEPTHPGFESAAAEVTPRKKPESPLEVETHRVSAEGKAASETISKPPPRVPPAEIVVAPRMDPQTPSEPVQPAFAAAAGDTLAAPTAGSRPVTVPRPETQPGPAMSEAAPLRADPSAIVSRPRPAQAEASLFPTEVVPAEDLSEDSEEVPPTFSWKRLIIPLLAILLSVLTIVLRMRS